MVDVTVMGAGAFGLSVAWACVRRGASVQVIDPKGVGAGSSGGVVGALAPHVPDNWNIKKAFQFDSLILSESWWRSVSETGGLPTGYGRTGRLQPVLDARGLELAYERIESAADLWQGHAQWQVMAREEFGAWAPHSPTGFLIKDTLSARMHPRLAAKALAAAVRAKGGVIVTEGAPEGQVVWATGYDDLMDISNHFGRVVGSGVKGQAAVLEYDAGGNAPQLVANAVHVIGHANGTVAVGSTNEREFDLADSVDSQLDAVIARAIEAVPILRGAAVIERWAGVRPRAKTRSPMLGEHPLRTGDFIANGGFKIGFGMAPKVGEVMADLVLDGVDGIPAGFKPEASL